MKRKPPKLAARLLENLSCNSALIGDVNEEYEQGRSYAWYWSQVFVTAATKIYEDGRFHPVLVARGVALGWVLMLLGQKLLERVFLKIHFEWLLEAHKSRMLFLLFGQPALFWVILFSLPCLVTALLVARLHQRQRVAVVLLFAASVLVISPSNLPWIVTLIANTWSNSRYLPYLVSDLFEIALPPLMIVLGGLYGRQSKAGTISQHQGILKAE